MKSIFENSYEKQFLIIISKNNFLCFWKQNYLWDWILKNSFLFLKAKNMFSWVNKKQFNKLSKKNCVFFY